MENLQVVFSPLPQNGKHYGEANDGDGQKAIGDSSPDGVRGRQKKADPRQHSTDDREGHDMGGLFRGRPHRNKTQRNQIEQGNFRTQLVRLHAASVSRHR